MRWRFSSRWFFIGCVAGLLSAGSVAFLVAALILFGGVYDTGASTPHNRIVAWALHTTMIHSVGRRASRIHPPPFTAAEVAAGSTEYQKHCVSCHGGPGVARARWTSAMLPTSPFIVDASRHWSPAQLYVLVHDGVKMTAMPAWGEMESDKQIWDIVAFLEALPTLSPQRFHTLQNAPASENLSHPTVTRSK